MDYLDEKLFIHGEIMSKIIDRHRADVLVTCETSCWCWKAEAGIRSYRELSEKVKQGKVWECKCGEVEEISVCEDIEWFSCKKCGRRGAYHD